MKRLNPATEQSVTDEQRLTGCVRLHYALAMCYGSCLFRVSWQILRSLSLPQDDIPPTCDAVNQTRSRNQ